MAVRGDAEALDVAFVCTGNRARSPLAELLFRQLAPRQTRISSYGTLDVGPLPALPAAVEAASALGLDLSGHRARPLSRGSLSSADLVLAFEPSHVAAAVVDGGADAGRTFMLRELVQLLGTGAHGDGPDGARHVIAAADTRRVRARPDPRAAITDPLGKPNEVMARIAQEIAVLVEELADGLFGAEGTHRRNSSVQ